MSYGAASLALVRQCTDQPPPSQLVRNTISQFPLTPPISFIPNSCHVAFQQARSMPCSPQPKRTLVRSLRKSPALHRLSLRSAISCCAKMLLVRRPTSTSSPIDCCSTHRATMDNHNMSSRDSRSSNLLSALFSNHRAVDMSGRPLHPSANPASFHNKLRAPD